MGRSLLFYLSLFCLLLACKQVPQESDPEKSEVSLKESWKYYQGSVDNMKWLNQAALEDYNNAEAWRELSIPYLKRGYPHLWFPLMKKTVDLDPSWTGSRGYNYLFFQKDYKRALADFRTTDSLTPGFSDCPQGMSIKYLKGLCFYGLDQYDSALYHFQSYIDEESAKFGADWVDQNAYLYKSIIYNKLSRPEDAITEANKGLVVFGQFSDCFFQKAIAYKSLIQVDSAHVNLAKSKATFDLGYNHKHAYVEVPDQLYPNSFGDFSISN